MESKGQYYPLWEKNRASIIKAIIYGGGKVALSKSDLTPAASVNHIASVLSIRTDNLPNAEVVQLPETFKIFSKKTAHSTL